MNKIYPNPEAALADVEDGASIMFGGFISAGTPTTLILALAQKGVRNLTVIANNPGFGDRLDILFAQRQVRKFIGSFPVRAGGEMSALEQQFRAGELEVEVVPQGTFVERIRAAGSGIAAFFSPTGAGTIVEQGKEKRVIDGQEYLLETALRADFAFVKAYRADTWGNLVYRKAARNFNPVIATAARVTIAEVEEIVPLGALDTESIETPGVFVQRVVQGERHDVRWFK